MVEPLIDAIGRLADPGVLIVIFLGSAFGFTLGLMPGLGGVQGLALAMPFTFAWDPITAMFFYAGIMGAVSEGGSVTAILLNTPGTAINAATCFDGYPMTRRGEAGRALGLAAASSSLGALFGLVVLVLLIPAVRPIVLSFGPPEFFWLVLFGLVAIAFAARGNLFKGLAAGGCGVLLSFIGNSDMFSVTRWSGNSEYLWGRLPLIPVFIGLFAVSELIIYTTRGGSIAKAGSERFAVKGLGQVFQGMREMFSYPLTFLRGSVIGTIVGIIPGIGGSVANFISYTTAIQCSKNPALFGKGNPEGIVAAEAANDAKDGGAILPTLAFGIPGSAEMAVFMGALILHGLEPGPMLILYHMDIVMTLILGLVLSNILAGLFLVFLASPLARLTFVPVYYIAPGALILAALGSLALRGNVWDIGLTFIAGVFGFALKRLGFPVITFAIGFILGALVEDAFHQSLMIAYGSYSIFFTRPICLILLGLIVLVLALPLVNVRRITADMPQQAVSRPFNRGSFLFTAILFVFVLIMMAVSFTYSFEARLVPWIVGIPTLLLLFASLTLEFFPGALRALEMGIEAVWGGVMPESGENAEDEHIAGPLNPARLLQVITWIISFFATTFIFGFFVSAGLFLFFFLMIEGRIQWLKAMVVAVSLVVLLYFVVERGLMLSLWPGVILEIIPRVLGGGITPPL